MPVELGRAVLSAACIAMAFLVAAWRPWMRKSSARADWGSALAMGIACIVADRIIFGPWSFPPSTTGRWIPYIAMAGAVIGITDPFRRGRVRDVYIAAAFAALVLSPLMWHKFVVLHLVMYAAAAVLLWSHFILA